MSAEIAVLVVWSPSARATDSVTLRLPPQASVAAAFASAGLSCAVWGKARPLAHPLCDGDRVEVLRDLQIDPMTARRVRFEAAGGVDALRQRGYAGRKQR